MNDFDERLERFEDAWQSDKMPALEAFLPRGQTPSFDSAGCGPLLLELVKTDLEYRWRQLTTPEGGPGRRPPERIRVERYLERFPELRSSGQALLELVRQEYWVRHCWGDGPDHQEYLGRFAVQAPALLEVLIQTDAELAHEPVCLARRSQAQSLTAPLPASAAAPVTVSGLLKQLQETGLLKWEQLDELARGQFVDPRSVARHALEKKWLTPFQVNQLLQGKGSSLLLGPYRLLDRLGEGATGKVFRVQHQKMNRVAALKVIRQELLSQPEAVKRFYKEIAAASQLSHPNVIHTYDAGPIENTHFLAMEYIEGIDLSRLVKQEGPLLVAQACDYIRQAADGLQHLHEHQLVHRDIKPSNLVVLRTEAQARLASWNCPWGVVKILDLGLAHGIPTQEALAAGTLTKEGTLMGTPDYMAPEQVQNAHRVDIRADLYALGCTFYYLLTGQAPFPGGTFIDKLDQHRWSEPQPVEQLRPDVPPAVAAILRQLMAKKPEDRYQTPGELALALRSVSVPGSAAVGAIKAAPRGWFGGSRRRRIQVGVGVVLLGLLVVVAVRSFMTPAGVPDQTHTFKLADPVSASAWVSRPAALDGLRTWTLETRGHRQAVQVVAFQPKGKLLASAGSEGVIRLWDVNTGRLERLLFGHTGEVKSLAWSSDGQRLVSGGSENVARVWHVDSGRLLSSFSDIRYALTAVVWSPDSKQLAVLSEDSTVRIFNPDKPKQEYRELKLEQPAQSLAWSPNGRTIATASGPLGHAGPGKIQLWETATGTAIPRPTMNHSAKIRFLAWSADGQTLAAADDDMLRFWQTGTGTKLHEEPTDKVCMVPLWLSEGKWIAVGAGKQRSPPLLLSANGAGTKWDVKKWDLKQSPDANVNQAPGPAMAWSLDGKTIAAGCVNGAVNVWRMDDDMKLPSQPGLNPVLFSVAVPHQGTTIAVGAERGISIWNTQSGTRIRHIGLRNLLSLAWSPNDARLAAGLTDGAIRLYGTQADAEVLLTPMAYKGTVRSMSWSPDGLMLASGYSSPGKTSGPIVVWDVHKPSPPRELQNDVEYYTGHFLAWSPDGKYLAWGGKTVLVWEVSTWNVCPVPKVEDVTGLHWQVDGKTVTALGAKGTWCTWDVPSGKVTDTGHLQKPKTQAVQFAAWRPDGRALAVACQYGHNFIVKDRWDAPPCEGLSMVGSPRFARPVAWSPEGKALITQEPSDQTVRFWDPDEGNLRGLIFPLKVDGGVVVNAEGHYRCPPDIEQELVFVAFTAEGQEVLTPAEFSRKYRWTNQPERVQLVEK